MCVICETEHGGEWLSVVASAIMIGFENNEMTLDAIANEKFYLIGDWHQRMAAEHASFARQNMVVKG